MVSCTTAIALSVNQEYGSSTVFCRPTYRKSSVVNIVSDNSCRQSIFQEYTARKGEILDPAMDQLTYDECGRARFTNVHVVSHKKSYISRSL